MTASAAGPPRPAGGGRRVLLAAAALLSAAAALAIGILLFGHFGETEGRILGTTAALGGYWLLALPAAALRDRRRLPALAAAVVALDLAAAALVVGAIWGDGGDALGRAVAAVNAWLAAAALVAGLAARRSAQDPPVVRRLLLGTAALAAVCAALVTALVVAEIDREGFARGLGALVVLLVLLAALQPILARARPVRSVHRLRVSTAAGAVELAVEARDLGEAAAKAIRSLEAEGRRVLAVELAEDGPPPAR